MENYEKNELKREITDEVKESLTRSSGSLITRRIILALVAVFIEALLWALILAAAVKTQSLSSGLFICLIACWVRASQAWIVVWFNEK